ncbi:MAG: SHOCT domain-containing protein [Nitrososphaerota archaeon]|nr:SHOCT domain-containing protein [Nitrososphaerota archaeon]
MSVLWSSKPFMKKTLVKFVIAFLVATALLSPLFTFVSLLIPFWLVFCFVFFLLYYFNKNAYAYFITDKSVRVEKSWFFGSYTREITFDQIRDVHVMQGILARVFNCGSLVFITTTGLEVGYVGGGAAVGRGLMVGGGAATPTIVRRGGNMFWDILEPAKAKEILMVKLTEWREVFHQQRIAASVEKIAEKTAPQMLLPTPTLQQPPAAPVTPTGTIVDQLERLKKLLDTGAITKEEYEKAKKKLLE